MTLLAPVFLLLALLAAPIIALHMRHKARVDVGSLMLWRRLVSDETAARLRWQPAQLSLPLWLQLAALAAFTLALAQPLWNSDARVDHAIYVVDASVDMQVAAELGSGFDSALKNVLHDMALEAGAATSRFTVIAAGVVPDIALARQPYAPAAFGEALDLLSADDGSADWGSTARLAEALIRPGEATRLTVLTVGTAPAELVELVPGGVVLNRVVPLSNVPNSAVSASAVMVDAALGTWEIEGLVVTHDPADSEKKVVLRFLPEGAQTSLEWARFTANESRQRGGRDASPSPRVFPFRHEVVLPAPGILLVEIEADARPADNIVRLTIAAAPPDIEILYVGPEGDHPARRAAAAIEGASLVTSLTLPADTARFDLIVIDGVRVDALPQTHTIWIGAADLQSEPEPTIAALLDPSDWRSDHLLGEGMHWAGIELAEAFVRAPHDNAVRLLGAKETVLVEAWTSKEGRQLRIGFELERSNWPERASLPALFSRFIRWAGIATLGGGRACIVGSPCSVDARLLDGPVTRLDGTMSAQLPFDIAAQVTFARDGRFIPTKAGLYQLGTAPHVQLIAVNAAFGDVLTTDGAGTALRTRPMQVWWMASVAALVLLLAEAAVTFQNPRARTHWALTLRGTASALVIATLLIPALELPLIHNATVMLETVSSTPAVDRRLDGDLPPALIQAGAPARVLNDLGSSHFDDTGQSARARMGESLLLAGAMLPPGSPGKLVMQDDGVTAAEDYAFSMAWLQRRAIIVDHIRFLDAVDPVFDIERIALPPLIYGGDDVMLSAIVSAPAADEVDLSIYKNDDLLARHKLALVAGRNRIETVINGPGTTGALYSVAIHADPSLAAPLSRNGVAVVPAATGPVAILSSSQEAADAFAASLSLEGLEGQVLLPSRFPAYLKDWLRYRAVVLLNVSARTMTTAQQELLEISVRDHGLGVIIVGGDSSFGPGGYLETPLDRLSPLSSDIPGTTPEAALVFVLDRSGSMQQLVADTTRLDIAKQATLSAIQRLDPRSSVGVVVFDDTAQTVVPLRRASEQSALHSQLSSFGPGGGTAIYPGLVDAFAQLRNSEAAIKHVVVMTDGLTQPADFEILLAAMRTSGITVSTVAIGSSNGVPVVQKIAEMGGGNFHTTTDFASLPSILAQEATLFSSAPVEKGNSQPIWNGPQDNYLALLPTNLPPIDGFVLTSAKPAAQVDLLTSDTSGELMPLLAHWRYGNGQVMALTTDATGVWSRQWQEMEGYGSFWAKAIRYHLSTNQRPGLTLQAERRGDEIAIRLSVLDENGLPATGQEALAHVGSGRDGSVVLREDDPGIYQGILLALAPGTKKITAFAGEDMIEGMIHIEEPARLSATSAATGALALSSISGGEMLGATTAISQNPIWFWVHTSIWPACIGLALMLFMIEVGLRYAWRPRFRATKSSGIAKNRH